MTAYSVFYSIQKSQNRIAEFCRKSGIEYLGLFGSVARKEKSASHDVDVLVRFNEPKGFEFISIRDGLSRIFKQRVDLVTEKALHPLLKKNILKEVVTIYESK